MTDTPEDITKTAWEVWARSRKEVMCSDQVAILAAALMEERERCAMLAEYWDDGDLIAGEIRSGEIPAPYADKAEKP
jgi:hypothetical protein